MPLAHFQSGPPHALLSSKYNLVIFCAFSKQLTVRCPFWCKLGTAKAAIPISSCSRLHCFQAQSFICSSKYRIKSVTGRPSPLNNIGSAWVTCSTMVDSPPGSFEDNVEQNEREEKIGCEKLRVLKQKMDLLGIDSKSCIPGQYSYMDCPVCKGGQTMERSLSVHITQNEDLAMWRCFRTKCGWAGKVFADSRAAYNGVNQMSKLQSSQQMTEESLGLEPLGEKLIAYFADRMISEATLQRNGVMQVSGEKNAIAFPYRRDGVLISCKYRSLDKRFWQEKNVEKIFYGLDDIKEAAEIIIVEGEIDKLSMEEAGLLNCVSVPDGAPEKVSTKELPSLEKVDAITDTAYRYLWNCKDYLDQASRIILATDGDPPGQALAKELARRLGKERCLLVRWPKKDEFDCFKDANEVLTHSGRDALKEVIKEAELYRLNG